MLYCFQAEDDDADDAEDDADDTKLDTKEEDATAGVDDDVKVIEWSQGGRICLFFFTSFTCVFPYDFYLFGRMSCEEI